MFKHRNVTPLDFTRGEERLGRSGRTSTPGRG